jgi:hypothetical protein
MEVGIDYSDFSADGTREQHVAAYYIATHLKIC